MIVVRRGIEGRTLRWEKGDEVEVGGGSRAAERGISGGEPVWREDLAGKGEGGQGSQGLGRAILEMQPGAGWTRHD
jgi:hypothetical protein